MKNRYVENFANLSLLDNRTNCAPFFKKTPFLASAKFVKGMQKASVSDEFYFAQKAKEEVNAFYENLSWFHAPRHEVRNVFATRYKDGSCSFFVPDESYLITHGKRNIPMFPKEGESDAERSRRRAKKIIKDLVRNNRAPGAIFITLTNGHPDTVDDNKFLKQVLKKFRHIKERLSSDFKYLLIPERHHTEAHRVHFHGILWGYPPEKMRYSGKLTKSHKGKHLLASAEEGSDKYKRFLELGWRPIYNLSLFDRNGFTTATMIENYDKTCSYMTKYVTKDMEKIYKQYYFRSNNLDLPEYVSYFCPAFSKSLQETGKLSMFENPKGLYLYVSKEDMEKLQVDDILQRQLQPMIEERMKLEAPKGEYKNIDKNLSEKF